MPRPDDDDVRAVLACPVHAATVALTEHFFNYAESFNLCTVSGMTEAPAQHRGARRRAQTRRKLTAAAGELIASKGIAGLRITEITETADVGIGSFYNHFATKEELVDAVVGETLQTLAAGIVDELDEDEDPALSAAIADRRFVRIAYEAPETARLFVNLAHGETIFEAAVRPYARRALDRGLAAGRFHVPDVDMALIVLTSSALAVIRAILEDRAPAAADVLHAESVLTLFGLDAAEAGALARRPLPPTSG